MLMLPPCDPALHCCRAAAFQRTGPAGVGPVATQLQPVFDVGVVVLQPSLRMRFICANRISTFLRSRRDCRKASVLASARTRSRTSSLTSRVTLRATDVVHLAF